MKWFYQLSVGNKIAVLSLLIAFIGLSFTLYQSFASYNIKSNESNITTGDNSPIITNTNGDLNFNFPTEDSKK